MMDKLWKLGASVLMGFACTALFLYAFKEFMPLLYMHLHGIKIRAELSEDYGFGMLMLFGYVGLAALLFPLLSTLIYARLTRFSDQKNSRNSELKD
ncbi:MAG: hypothetical protein ACRENG_13345 [bacterium]